MMIRNHHYGLLMFTAHEVIVINAVSPIYSHIPKCPTRYFVCDLTGEIGIYWDPSIEYIELPITTKPKNKWTQ